MSLGFQPSLFVMPHQQQQQFFSAAASSSNASAAAMAQHHRAATLMREEGAAYRQRSASSERRAASSADGGNGGGGGGTDVGSLSLSRPSHNSFYLYHKQQESPSPQRGAGASGGGRDGDFGSVSPMTTATDASPLHHHSPSALGSPQQYGNGPSYGSHGPSSSSSSSRPAPNSNNSNANNHNNNTINDNGKSGTIRSPLALGVGTALPMATTNNTINHTSNNSYRHQEQQQYQHQQYGGAFPYSRAEEEEDDHDDLLAMTDEEKQRFASQLNQWERNTVASTAAAAAGRTASSASGVTRWASSGASPSVPNPSPADGRDREGSAGQAGSGSAYTSQFFKPPLPNATGHQQQYHQQNAAALSAQQPIMDSLMGSSRSGVGNNKGDGANRSLSAQQQYVCNTLHNAYAYDYGRDEEKGKGGVGGRHSSINARNGSNGGGMGGLTDDRSHSVATTVTSSGAVSRRPSTLGVTHHHHDGRASAAVAQASIVADSNFYKRNESWMAKVQSALDKQKAAKEQVAAAECTFAPIVNKQSARLVSQHRQADSVVSRERAEEELSAHRQRAAAAFTEYMQGLGGSGSDAAGGTAGALDQRPVADGKENFGGGSGRGGPSSLLKEHHASFGQGVAGQQHHRHQRPSSSSPSSPSSSSSLAAAAASRLYADRHRRLKNREALVATAEEEHRQAHTFAPRVCDKPWTSSITPRYLDAYVDGLQQQLEGEGGHDGGGDEGNGGGAVGYLSDDGRATSVGRSTVFSIPTDASARRARSALGQPNGATSARRGGVNGNANANNSSSVARSRSARSRANTPNTSALMDEDCTFRPVTNSLNRLQQQYRGVSNSVIHSGNSGGANNTVANTSLFGDEATAAAEPRINMEALEAYLALPAHERLALDAQRKQQTQRDHQRQMDRLIADQSKPIINARSASVVAMMMKQQQQDDESRQQRGVSGGAAARRVNSAITSHNASSIYPSSSSVASSANHNDRSTAGGASTGNNTSAAAINSFLTRLEASTAKREAKRELLITTIAQQQTPFTPRTNRQYNKVVKSHFERDAEEVEVEADRGRGGGGGRGGGEGNDTSRVDWRAASSSKAATPRRAGSNAPTSQHPSVSTSSAATPRRTGGGAADTNATNRRVNPNASVSIGGPATPLASHRRAGSQRRGTTSPSNDDSANKAADDPECTFAPTINASSRAMAKGKSRYQEVEAAAKRREMRLEQLREELALERERREWGIADEDLGMGGGGGPDGARKMVPSARDLTPRKPFSPSITRRTEEIARAKHGGGGGGNGRSASSSMSLAKMTAANVDSEEYSLYLAATNRRKEMRMEEQRLEQQARDAAELTFRPVVHDVPDHIRAMGQRLRGIPPTAANQATSSSAIPVYRASSASAPNHHHRGNTAGSNRVPLVSGWDGEGPSADGGGPRYAAPTASRRSGLTTSSSSPAPHQANAQPSLGMRFT